MFLEVLRVTLHKKGAHLHAGCVTPNEAHLAIQNGEGSVTAITGSFCHEYARRFNRNHDESGGLFRTHPHVLLIQHPLWLVPLAHVIHWIPKLPLLQSEVGECSWSSDAVYRNRARREGLITHVVFHIVAHGARHRDAQDEAYRRRFDKPPAAEHLRLFAHGSQEDPRMLGDAEFVSGIWRTTHQQPPRQTRVVSVASLNDNCRHAVIDVVERFGAMCDMALPPHRARAWKRVVTLEQLCSHSRKRPLPMMRAMSASYVIKHQIATRAQTARFFGCRPQTLSAQRRRHYEELFRQWFGAMPDILFSRRRDGDGGVGRKNGATRRIVAARRDRNSRDSCDGP
jgi:hypothetical protein